MSLSVFVQSLGAHIFTSLIIIAVGLFLKLGFKKAFRSGISVGVGLIGSYIILNFVWGKLDLIISEISNKFHIGSKVIDVGWAVSSVIAFSTVIGVIIIPFTLLLNYVALKLKVTKTINTDIWNYWHYSFTGSMVFVVTNSFVLGLMGSGIHCIISLKIADISAKKVQESLGVPGVSIPHGFAVTQIPICFLLDKMYDKIPFFNKNTEKNQDKIHSIFLFLSEPVVMGFLIGGIIGTLGADFTQSFFQVLKTILSSGINFAIIMILMPRIVKVIMEGILPISKGAKGFMGKYFYGEEYYNCLDAAVILGQKTTVRCSVILIPVTIILALVLPGVTVIPFADLGALTFFVALATPMHKRNFRRTFCSGVILTTIALYCSSIMSKYFTEIAVIGGTGIIDEFGLNNITAMTSGGNYLTAVISYLMTMDGLGIILLLVGTVVVVFFTIKNNDFFGQ